MTLSRLTKNALVTPNAKQIDEETLSNTVISNLVLEIIVASEAAEKGIFITDADVTNRIQQVMNRNGIQELEQFKSALQLQGFSYEQYSEQIKKSLLMQAYIDQSATFVRPDAEEIKAFYEKEKNKSLRLSSPVFKLEYMQWGLESSISFSEKLAIQKRFTELRETMIEEGLSFAEAKEKMKKKDRDDISIDQTDWVFLQEIGLSEQYSEPIEQLKLSTGTKNSLEDPSTVSDVLPTEQGMALFRLIDIRKTGAMPESLANRIVERKIMEDRRRENFNKLVGELLESTYIEKRVDYFSVDF